MKKPPAKTSLASFAGLGASAPAPVAAPAHADGEIRTRAATATKSRRRGQGNRVRLTLYLTPGEWQRMHEVGMAAGVSLNHLMIEGLNEVFRSRGLSILRNLEEAQESGAS